MNYRDYIQSDDWQLKRLKRIKRDGERKCSMCHLPGPTDIHHKTYKRLGSEHLSDLVQLCRSCHDIIHDYFQIGDGRVDMGYHRLSKAWIAHANRWGFWGLRRTNPAKFTRLADEFFRNMISGRQSPKPAAPKPKQRFKPCKLKLTPFQQRVCSLVASGYGVTADTSEKAEDLETLVAYGRIRKSASINGVYVAHSAVVLRGVKT